MRVAKAFWPVIPLLVSLPIVASHLTEEQVAALEAKCQERRAELLDPQKLEVLDECLAAGEEGVTACREKAARQGEVRVIGPHHRVGEHYDLPECVEAYRARKHYQVNPNLRDR